MIYLKGDGVKILILETANLEEIKNGRPLKTPDGEVLVCWTPDPVWLADKLMDTDGDAKAIGRLIDESSRRPGKPSGRPTHGPYLKSFLGGAK